MSKIIELNNINKSYGDKCIFKNFNLSVNTGEFVGILGKSGEGKTTLLNIIGCIEKFDGGTLTIKNVKNPLR